MGAGPVIGSSVERKEAWDKVTGAAKYTDDFIIPGILHAKLLTSPFAHAKIISVDTSAAAGSPGVKAVITGADFPILYGVVLEDHPPIATGKVRYFSEPVAMVVASSEREAMHAAKLIKVEYEPLPVVNSVSDAARADAPLVHEDLASYKHAVKGVYPEPNTNIADRICIRKGNMTEGWAQSEVVVEAVCKLPKSDHMAMETRTARAEIHADGEVVISSSTQSPFSVRKMLSQYFNLDEGKVVVKTPLVGGGFGGKSPVQLEILAYMASKAVGGKLVKIANSREEDLVTSPCKLGLEARIKLGASRSGFLKAVEMTFLVDTGAYTDIGPRLAKSIAADCTGPYNIDNVWCDSLCVYTNHPYSTSYRSFGHVSCTFCMERAIDKLAKVLGADPLELRLKNALCPGQTTPTQVKTTMSNLGNLTACLKKLKDDINWNEGILLETGNDKLRAKGLSCLWKTSDSPTDSVSGVFLTFNTDGSINLNSGAVEIGPGMKTTLAQILAEKMKMDISRVHVKLEVDTRSSPEHWKTVASMTTYMAGRAVLRAAEDLMRQLRGLAAVIMRCPPEDLDIAEEKVFLKQDPTMYVAFKDLVHGFKYPNGNAIEGQILGRGSFIMSHITELDKETGKGKPGPAWTVGAQAVEIEYDKTEHTYRILKACTVIDAGKVINPKTARGLITGGMCMGLGLGSREAFLCDNDGKVLNTSLRTYKVMHIGEEPEYIVDFLETPQVDAPFGARGIAEHGIIGIPAALANALSAAAGVEPDELPLTPEYIWKLKGGQT